MHDDGTSRCESLCKAAGAGPRTRATLAANTASARESPPPGTAGNAPRDRTGWMRHGRQPGTPYAHPTRQVRPSAKATTGPKFAPRSETALGSRRYTAQIPRARETTRRKMTTAATRPETKTIPEPATAVNWHPPADWHEDPGAPPRRDHAAIEVYVLPTDRTPGADGAPYPITIAENRAGQASIDVGSMVLLERDREAARQEEADPVRFARVDFVGTLQNGRRLLHVRWFRSTTSTGGFAFFRHAPAPDPLRNPAGHPGARRQPPRHPTPTGATSAKPQRRPPTRPRTPSRKPRERHDQNHHQACRRRRRQPLPLRLQPLQHDGPMGPARHRTGRARVRPMGQPRSSVEPSATPRETRAVPSAAPPESSRSNSTGSPRSTGTTTSGSTPWSTALLERFAAAGAGHLMHAACFRAAERERKQETATSD